jgi:hypothetical protein
VNIADRSERENDLAFIKYLGGIRLVLVGGAAAFGGAAFRGGACGFRRVVVASDKTERQNRSKKNGEKFFHKISFPLIQSEYLLSSIIPIFTSFDKWF